MIETVTGGSTAGAFVFLAGVALVIRYECWRRRVIKAGLDPNLKDMVLEGNEDSVYCMAWSPNGALIATGCADATVRIWKVKKCKELTYLMGHYAPVWSLAWGSDNILITGSGGQLGPKGKVVELYGQSIVVDEADNTVRIWDVLKSVQRIGPFKLHEDSVRAVAYSSDGRWFSSGSDDKTINLHHAEDGELLRTIDTDCWILSLAYSPDSKKLAAGCSDHKIRVLDAQTGDELLTVKLHFGRIWSVSFSPDGRRLISTSDDMVAKIWDANTGRVHFALSGHEGAIRSGVFSPDGFHIATASMDRTVRLWDSKTGKAVKKPLTGLEGSALSVGFSPDGVYVACSGGKRDPRVLIWDVRTGHGANMRRKNILTAAHQFTSKVQKAHNHRRSQASAKRRRGSKSFNSNSSRGSESPGENGSVDGDDLDGTDAEGLGNGTDAHSVATRDAADALLPPGRRGSRARLYDDDDDMKSVYSFGTVPDPSAGDLALMDDSSAHERSAAGLNGDDAPPESSGPDVDGEGNEEKERRGSDSDSSAGDAPPLRPGARRFSRVPSKLSSRGRTPSSSSMRRQKSKGVLQRSLTFLRNPFSSASFTHSQSSSKSAFANPPGGGGDDGVTAELVFANGPDAVASQQSAPPRAANGDGPAAATTAGGEGQRDRGAAGGGDAGGGGGHQRGFISSVAQMAARRGSSSSLMAMSGAGGGDGGGGGGNQRGSISSVAQMARRGSTSSLMAMSGASLPRMGFEPLAAASKSFIASFSKKRGVPPRFKARR